MLGKTRRLVRVVTYVVVVLALLAAGLIWYIGREGSTIVERWIGERLIKVARSYIRPEIDFEDLDYNYPKTVRMNNLRITADDPDNPGSKIDILFVPKARMELEEIPKPGKPFRIRELVLEGPRIRMIATAGKDSGLIGFSRFLTDSATKPQQEQPPEVRLDEVFNIRLARLIDGELTYEQRGQDSPPLRVTLKEGKSSITIDDAGAMDASLDITAAHLTRGEFQVLADAITGDFHFADEVAELRKVKAATLGGEVELSAVLGLAEQARSTFALDIRGIQLAETLRATGGGEQDKPRYKGIVNGRIDLAGPLKQITEQADGGGRIDMEKGRIAKLPIISDIFNLLTKKIDELTGGDYKGDDRDTAKLLFDFAGDRFHCKHIEAKTPTIALFGLGDVYFDSRLDLEVNGGPLEKVESLFGSTIGGLMHLLTKQIVTYEVKGTLDEPKITPVPFKNLIKLLPKLD